jgi:hypothetical protein
MITEGPFVFNMLKGETATEATFSTAVFLVLMLGSLSLGDALDGDGIKVAVTRRNGTSEPHT